MGIFWRFFRKTNRIINKHWSHRTLEPEFGHRIPPAAFMVLDYSRRRVDPPQKEKLR